MSIQGPISVIKNRLMLYLDSSNIKSFSLNRGVWNDLSQVSSITGNFRNNVAYSNANLGAIVFNGVNGYVELPTSVLDNYTSGTICCWTKLNSVSAATITARQYDGTGTYAVFSVGSYPNSAGANTVGTSGKLYWHGKNGVNTAASNGTISANSNNFICVTFNGSKATFYINGRYDSEVAGDYSAGNSGGVLNPNYTQVGAWNNNSTVLNPTDGIIYSLTIYDQVLTPDEILQNYDFAKTRFIDINTGTTTIITTPVPTTTTAAATTTTAAVTTTTTTAATTTTSTTAAATTTTPFVPPPSSPSVTVGPQGSMPSVVGVPFNITSTGQSNSVSNITSHIIYERSGNNNPPTDGAWSDTKLVLQSQTPALPSTTSTRVVRYNNPSPAVPGFYQFRSVIVVNSVSYEGYSGVYYLDSAATTTTAAATTTTPTPTYTVTLTKGTGGNSLTATGIGSANGTFTGVLAGNYTLSASPADGYIWIGWVPTGGCNPVTSANPTNLIVSGNGSVSAAWNFVGYTVTIVEAVSPGSPTPPPGYGPANGTVTGGGTYAANASVTVAATADSDSDFASMTDSVAGPVSSPHSFTINQSRTITVNWSWKNVVWKTVSSPAEGGSTNQTTFATVPKQTFISLIATASPGYTFSHWTGPAVVNNSGVWGGRCTQDGENIFTAVFVANTTTPPPCNVKSATYTYVEDADQWQVLGTWTPCGGSATSYFSAVDGQSGTAPEPSPFTLGCGESVSPSIGGSTSGASC